jgi:hypothetical protein
LEEGKKKKFRGSLGYIVSETLSQKPKSARCCWLTAVTLATQEAEIRRIMVQSQPKTNRDWQSGSSGKRACLATMNL